MACCVIYKYIYIIILYIYRERERERESGMLKILGILESELSER